MRGDAASFFTFESSSLSMAHLYAMFFISAYFFLGIILDDDGFTVPYLDVLLDGFLSDYSK
ncbi:hypothetical protein PbDSM24746_47580 [Paenibacillus macerans]|nr:hypothetical protein PbDSM24746_47580 [Paenibacillus macerans]GBK70812.1 hypothetical protein PbJCM17693_45200 [Paenibacillus macerans]GIP11919.1 hypothetical protein J1TS5_40890 [Paenibacillus macerans]